MVRARTTLELLRELEEEAHTSAAALVVSLAGLPVLIWANDPSREEVLARTLSEGGEAIGLLRKTETTTETRAFCEYADDPSAVRLLGRVRD